MAFAAGAAVTIPAISALGTIAYYAKHPDEEGAGSQRQRRSSTGDVDRHREFIIDDDPSEFSSFTSAPSAIRQQQEQRRASQTSDTKPDNSLLVDPQLQTWRNRYKWGRNYGMNFAHNDK
ncbi:hypothetical protein GGF46_004942 [Coemansia sp. RSA 552]|nr:hypothetical protein GGF46_004942 [Coemansia sp. RSA 552]